MKDNLPSFIQSIDDFEHMKIVYLKGNLDSAASADMDYFFKKEQKTPAQLNKSFLLDFRKVENVDSAGIAQLFKLLTLLKKKKYRLGLINLPDRVQGMLEILKLDKAFHIFETRTQALEEIRRWSEGWD
jgi:anti-anti-sigma factor